MTISITFTLSAISAIAGLALTLQSAPVHRGGGPTVKWPGPFFSKRASKKCHIHSGIRMLDLFAKTKRDGQPCLVQTMFEYN